MDLMLSEVSPMTEDDSFHRVEDFKSSDVRAPNLTHPIHPLFQTIAGMDENHRYPVTACRLASLLLEKGLPIFHSILVIGDSVASCNNGTIEHVCPEPKASLTIAEQQRTRAKLNELATGVSLILDLKGKASGQAAHAVCTTDSRVTFPQLPGRGSKIQVNVKTLNNVLKAEDSRDIVAILWFTIVLATSLVHEMAHAALNSTQTCRCNGLYFGASQTSENGYDLETFLFGGILEQYGSDDDPRCYYTDDEPTSVAGMICCEEYPNFSKLTVPLPGVQAMFRGRPLPDTYVLWNTPFPWIHNLLQQNFWDDALTGDNHALHPPRTSGLIEASSTDPAVKAQQQQARATELMASDDDSEWSTTSSDGEEEEQQE
ncbi:hypothetical protein CKM354_000472800 [Cercospora kikuchii]|uniref:Uncharacterized protein n=1 Tax=Cercospora kikuchii TaxID=84275 RepID=A0A9P3CBZ1_9PEZI|nr:uncharacterized protein CKM354_000472800 [Cercospora kikuchii]GIZ41424.1 hypothetical protein CKM354_000472800 [Cercospora kikuchii]